MPIDAHQETPDLSEQNPPSATLWLAEQRHHAAPMVRRLMLCALADTPLALAQAPALAWLAAPPLDRRCGLGVPAPSPGP